MKSKSFCEFIGYKCTNFHTFTTTTAQLLWLFDALLRDRFNLGATLSICASWMSRS